jgi:hypothetical protein
MFCVAARFRAAQNYARSFKDLLPRDPRSACNSGVQARNQPR